VPVGIDPFITPLAGDERVGKLRSSTAAESDFGPGIGWSSTFWGILQDFFFQAFVTFLEYLEWCK
jgi:hypothetical protein